MASCATYEEWARIEGNDTADIYKEIVKEEWKKLKLLRDCNLISNEKFQSVKKKIFSKNNIKTNDDLFDFDDIEFDNLQRLKVKLDKGELTQDEFNRKVKIFVHIN